MIRYLTFVLLIFVLFSCDNEKKQSCACGLGKSKEVAATPEEAMQIVAVQDTSTTGDAEFQQNKEKIEKKFGEQWDFCHCVLVNDSLDKMAKKGQIDDRFMTRFDEVEQHCKAFLVLDESTTPEDREIHDKKVKKCLRAAGIR